MIGKVVSYKNNYVSIKLFDKVSIHDGLRIKDEDEYGLTLNEFRVNNKQVYEAYKNDIITFKVNKKLNVDSLVYKTLSYEIDNNISKIIKEILHFKYKRKSLLYGFSIPINTFGPGLNIIHLGTILINGNAKVGNNCRINAGVVIRHANAEKRMKHQL